MLFMGTLDDSTLESVEDVTGVTNKVIVEDVVVDGATDGIVFLFSIFTLFSASAVVVVVVVVAVAAADSSVAVKIIELGVMTESIRFLFFFFFVSSSRSMNCI